MIGDEDALRSGPTPSFWGLDADFLKGPYMFGKNKFEREILSSTKIISTQNLITISLLFWRSLQFWHF